ncbi:unnamed protein product [Triticum turgidum subsp. durum]|uniref:Uncharacterized protein n=1 Tax=Triticum turgidum subsp. durum TaxID=4567 RepID=A0A9R1B1T1_TRITD|nr:unnamed protein product [Triticum turgidum subsp. durum]
MRTSTYITSHGPKVQDDDSLQLQVPLLKHKKRGGSKAPAVILLFECLESTAFNGISTNLVVYLETVLHGTNLASASNVATWFGTSYLTPVFGAIIADSFWGNYNTILVSLKISIKVPAEAGHLYEVSDKIDSPQPRIAHTSDFKFLDKAAIVTESDMEERPEAATSWKLCTVTQRHRVIGLLADEHHVRAAGQCHGNDHPVGAGARGVAGLVRGDMRPDMGAPLQQGDRASVEELLLERRRRAVTAAADGRGEAPHGSHHGGGGARGNEAARQRGAIAQLEFFFGEAPDTMKSMCTSLALLTIALGSYMSSFIYAIVEAFTATGDSPGWISDDLNKGHLDYFFWAMAAMCTLNFVVYSGIVKNYRLKTVIS